MKPKAHSMVIPRYPTPILTGRWKVTGRYVVHLPKGVAIDAVRLSTYSLSGNAVTIHLELTEFNRLFKGET